VNWQARHVLDSIEDIIAMCFPGEDQVVEHNKWVNTIQLYQQTMKVSYSFVVSFINFNFNNFFILNVLLI